MIEQITVFIENEKGHLASLCRTLGDEGIQMHALMVADTSDFGVVRIICDDPVRANSILRERGYRSSLTNVLAVEVPDIPGGLASVLESLARYDVNVEYAYCFALNDMTVDILKVEGEDIVEKLTATGFHTLQPSDLYALQER
jgi:hypothetical protein